MADNWKMADGGTTIHYSVTETAQFIRKAIKAAFPDVKFSVRSERYSGGSSIDVRWLNGPTTKQVEAVAKQYQGADFDGMTDSTTYRQVWVNGARVHYGADHVFCERATR